GTDPEGMAFGELFEGGARGEVEDLTGTNGWDYRLGGKGNLNHGQDRMGRDVVFGGGRFSCGKRCWAAVYSG
ncbi:MAG: hypothetical protein NTX27_09605, partial [Verrucomicrobia bacterium]|nr:hypothetical protein [Verrucomicrobiota bacterium]